jgi:hypothetical protein
VVANLFELFNNRGVGFIEWLGGGGKMGVPDADCKFRLRFRAFVDFFLK